MSADNYEQANSLVPVDVNGLVANARVAHFDRVPRSRSIVNRVYAPRPSNERTRARNFLQRDYRPPLSQPGIIKKKNASIEPIPSSLNRGIALERGSRSHSPPFLVTRNSMRIVLSRRLNRAEEKIFAKRSVDPSFGGVAGRESAEESVPLAGPAGVINRAT